MSSNADPSLAVKDKRIPRKKLPIFIGQSGNDTIASISQGQALYQALVNIGGKGEFKVYDYEEHWIKSPEGVNDMVDFLNKMSLTTQYRALWAGRGKFNIV
ncbi:hypothetical protein BKA64DRAFT_646861 [Cadophora sp. MPI-SDFR-AT-0126]|nr:hypothetical protein BKA64DRAFT_646861 [Leotiomycetes sp. MPI-SDFR-AT-0126]